MIQPSKEFLERIEKLEQEVAQLKEQKQDKVEDFFKGLNWLIKE